MDLVCISCPNGCLLSINENMEVNGNKCKKGIEFAINEITNPKRIITSTVKSIVSGYDVIPVKTNNELPKKMIFNLMDLLKNVKVKEYLPIGSVVLNNVFNTGVDVITTIDMKKEGE